MGAIDSFGWHDAMNPVKSSSNSFNYCTRKNKETLQDNQKYKVQWNSSYFEPPMPALNTPLDSITDQKDGGEERF